MYRDQNRQFKDKGDERKNRYINKERQIGYKDRQRNIDRRKRNTDIERKKDRGEKDTQEIKIGREIQIREKDKQERKLID